jgi:hypothetical protein
MIAGRTCEKKEVKSMRRMGSKMASGRGDLMPTVQTAFLHIFARIARPTSKPVVAVRVKASSRAR